MQQYNYSKTMMMKLFMAETDGRGGSKVFCDLRARSTLCAKPMR